MNTKKLKLFVLALIALFIIVALTSRGNAQTITPEKYETGKEYHIRLQRQNSWENYQATYRKTMLANAKEASKQKKEQAKAIKQRQKFLARIERIKGN